MYICGGERPHRSHGPWSTVDNRSEVPGSIPENMELLISIDLSFLGSPVAECSPPHQQSCLPSSAQNSLKSTAQNESPIVHLAKNNTKKGRLLKYCKHCNDLGAPTNQNRAPSHPVTSAFPFQPEVCTSMLDQEPLSSIPAKNRLHWQ